MDDTSQNHNGLPTDVNKSPVSETESSVFGMWTEEPLNNAISNHANKHVAQRMGKKSGHETVISRDSPHVEHNPYSGLHKCGVIQS